MISAPRLLAIGLTIQTLLGISTSAIDEQEQLLEEHFLDWSNGEPQVDDICVMGVLIG